ncbi:putative mitochondrial F1F0 ATP synthase subunit Atp18 [Saccharata proteae CBS 121410]|uniref:Mitochondrial F1F0 ATP synthase subunit Atp18 n=1 Tax=Saccharata proteae CBS 121410 TaxID=1314787 RepID=A0A9P4HY99_9PEZI|nr:putative mitochondrial F1F0 ATP synthase subunit Atp18 [Saccharata proteae CBS 121410]
MSLLGPKFPAPVARPMAPFYAAGLVILYGVNSFANAMYNSAEFKDDPRNPLKKTGADAGH